MVSIFDGKELNRLRADPFRSYRRPVSKDEVRSHGCIIYGAGVEGRLVLSCLKDAGVIPLFFADRNPALHGMEIDGVMVRPPAELLNHRDSLIIIASCWVRSIIQANPFLENTRYVVWSAINNFCPVLPEMAESVEIFLDNDDVLKAYTLMSDDKSREIFKNFIKFQICYDEDIFSNYDPVCYFPSDLPVNHHRFVDAGAADGDTLRVWLGHGFPKSPEDRYYAFEPSLAEFGGLQSLVAELPLDARKIMELRNTGLGEKTATLYLNESGKSSRLVSHMAGGGGGLHGQNVEIVRLDDALPTGARPTLIKADVEGAELSLLDGARATIANCAPDLAMSVYHRYSDLWQIPLWINQQDNGYAIFLRHHTKAYDDVVCYALRR